MLMLQSSIAALVRRDPHAEPRDVLCTVNRVLHDNLQRRVNKACHATLVLLRIGGDGSVVFAGAHEEVLVLRASTGRCETVDTTGTWVGAVADIARATTSSTLELQVGDVLVVFTDGITEAANDQGERFGVERLAAAVEASHEDPVERIKDEVLAAARAWSAEIEDDQSVVVARYRGAPGRG
jgi:sigma-B regulation protein RsbU (phosphoserine phosphatase)